MAYLGHVVISKKGGIAIGGENVVGETVESQSRKESLLLHGGPGATHEAFEALERFAGAEGMELVYYDQLGSAWSDQPKDESLWTVERFVDEVEQVRQALGLTKDNFYLLGHSWGGILATEYRTSTRNTSAVSRNGPTRSTARSPSSTSRSTC